MIGGPRKEVLKWKKGQKSFSHKPAGCPINSLPQLLFPASPPGPPASVAFWRADTLVVILKGCCWHRLPGSWFRGWAGMQTFLDHRGQAGQGTFSLTASCSLVLTGSSALACYNQPEVRSWESPPPPPSQLYVHQVGSHVTMIPLITSPALTPPLSGDCCSSLPAGLLHSGV